MSLPVLVAVTDSAACRRQAMSLARSYQRNMGDSDKRQVEKVIRAAKRSRAKKYAPHSQAVDINLSPVELLDWLIGIPALFQSNSFLKQGLESAPDSEASQH